LLSHRKRRTGGRQGFEEEFTTSTGIAVKRCRSVEKLFGKRASRNAMQAQTLQAATDGANFAVAKAKE